MPTAFKATYSDWKLVKTRGVVQIVFEVPLAEADDAYDILGGMPNGAKERWFGIAALVAGAAAPAAGRSMARDSERSINPGGRHALTPDASHNSPRDASRDEPAPERHRRDWRSLPYPQQAGIRIGEATFAAYLREEHPDEWHETGEADGCLKFICKIDSKSELATNHKAATLWHQIDSAYQAWKAVEHA